MGAFGGSQHEEGVRLSQKTLRSLEQIDEMTPALRSCVHEFGSPIVASLVNVGITNPKQIRSVVHSIWMGARQPAQRNPIGRERTPVLDSLDWLLLQAGAQISAATLVRHLAMHSMVIVPKEPSTVMVDASMHAIDGMTSLNKPTKHRIRLRTAIEASTRRLWPHLFDAKPSPTPAPARPADER